MDAEGFYKGDMGKDKPKVPCVYSLYEYNIAKTRGIYKNTAKVFWFNGYGGNDTDIIPLNELCLIDTPEN